MPRHLPLLLMLLLPAALLGQGDGGHRPLRAENPIPQEFRQLSSEKYLSSRERLDRARDGRQRTRVIIPHRLRIR